MACRASELEKQLSEAQSSARDSIDKLTKDLESVSAEFTAAQAAASKEKADLETRCNDAAAQAALTQKKISDAEQQVTVTKLNADEAVQRHNRATAQMKSEQEEVKAALKQSEALQQKLGMDVEKKETEIEDLRERLNDMSNRSALKEAEIKAVQVFTLS